MRQKAASFASSFLGKLPSFSVRRRETFPHQDAGGSVALSVKVIYALPAFATHSLSFMISIYAADFYSQMGASLSFLAFFTALARSFDVITDPFMGWWSDSTRSSMGRRRPYMAMGCFFYAVFLVALFTPPAFRSATSAALWFGLCYTGFYLFDTICNVPYDAWGPELSDNYDERSKVFFVKKLMMFIGTIFAAASPALISHLFRHSQPHTLPCSTIFSPSGDVILPAYTNSSSEPCFSPFGGYCFPGKFKGKEMYFEASAADVASHCFNATSHALLPSATASFHVFAHSISSSERLSFLITSSSFALWYIAAVVLVVVVVRERAASSELSAVPVVPSVLRSFKNRAFRPLLFGWFFDAIASANLVTMFPFFIRYVVDPEGPAAHSTNSTMPPQVLMGLCVVALLSAAIVASPLWLYLSHKFGKYRTWMAYNVVNVVTNLLFIIPTTGHPWTVILLATINGFPLGGQFLVDSILADVIDYDEFLNGTRSEGGFTVFGNIIPKFVAIPAMALPIAIINLLGFVPPVHNVAQPQPASVKAFIRIVFVFLPLTFSLFGFIAKTFFPIKNRLTSLTLAKGIEAHMNKLPFKDPLTGEIVSLMEMTKDEEQQVWLFENFSASSLEKLLAYGPRGLRRSMLVLFLISFASFLALVSVLVVTFPYLSDPAFAVIPILAVIFAGGCLCWLIVNWMRLRAAYQVSKLMLSDDSTRSLIERLLLHKNRGQRGGDPLSPVEEQPEIERSAVSFEDMEETQALLEG